MLPSEAELCAEFGVSRNTVRRALALLEAEGVILAIPPRAGWSSAATGPATSRTCIR